MSASAPASSQHHRASDHAAAHDHQTGEHSLVRLLFDALRLPPSIVLSSLVINVLGLALPLVILQIFDRVLRNQSMNTLSLLIAGLLGVILVETILRMARNALLGHVALRDGFRRHMRTARHLLSAPRSATAKQQPETVFDSLSAIDDINAFFSGSGRLALLDFPFVLLFLAVIWLIGGILAAIPAMLIIGFVGWAIWASRGFKRALEAQQRGERDRFSFYAECLSGIATIKSLAIEPQMERRGERILHDGAEANYRFVLHANRMIAAGQLFASGTMISIVTVGGYLAIHGDLSLGAVAACTLIANRVTQPVLRIIGIWGQMEAARLARDRAQTIHAWPGVETAADRPSGPAEIELREVAMRESVSDVSPVGISLTLAPGSVTGFACRQFTERMQFQDLLRGRLHPDQGVILIDGRDVAGDEGAALAEQSFFIGAEPVVFRGTILENIAMFQSGVGQIKAVSAARRLGIDPEIQSLPDGYETRLGDSDSSALPRELLCALDIARVVAARPRMVIMSRRLSSGGHTIETIAAQRAIAELRGQSTVVLLGDHPDELVQADRVYALEGWLLREITEAQRQGIGERERSLVKRLADSEA